MSCTNCGESVKKDCFGTHSKKCGYFNVLSVEQIENAVKLLEMGEPWKVCERAYVDFYTGKAYAKEETAVKNIQKHLDGHKDAFYKIFISSLTIDKLQGLLKHTIEVRKSPKK